jgi:hypothetical protein
MKRYASILAGIVLVGLVSPVKADLIVSVADITLAPGGNGFVDVRIRSTANDTLDTFGVEFRITTFFGINRLEFVGPPSDTQLGDLDYIFAGDSAAAMIGPPAGLISTMFMPNDTYVGGDGTFSGLGVTVPATDRLLVRLELTAATALAPKAGDIFTISLVSSPNTFFRDSGFSEIDFVSSPGTVTIAGAAAIVPEPSSLTLLAMGGFSFLIGRRRWCPDLAQRSGFAASEAQISSLSLRAKT